MGEKVTYLGIVFSAMGIKEKFRYKITDRSFNELLPIIEQMINLSDSRVRYVFVEEGRKFYFLDNNKKRINSDFKDKFIQMKVGYGIYGLLGTELSQLYTDAKNANKVEFEADFENTTLIEFTDILESLFDVKIKFPIFDYKTLVKFIYQLCEKYKITESDIDYYAINEHDINIVQFAWDKGIITEDVHVAEFERYWELMWQCPDMEKLLPEDKSYLFDDLMLPSILKEFAIVVEEKPIEPNFGSGTDKYDFMNYDD